MLHYICAMRCEAAPILEHFRMQPLKQAGVFPLFMDKQQTTSLTISGIGKLAAAAAVTYTGTLLAATKSDAWLNVGIAGHAQHAYGLSLLAHKITDAGSGTRWYPQILFDAGVHSAAMRTLDSPSSDYNDELYEMEGAGFYSGAIRFGSAELIHCLKIISDNNTHPVAALTEKSIRAVIAQNIDVIAGVDRGLRELAADSGAISSASPWYEPILELRHFTQYQRNRLQHLLQRWHSLAPDIKPPLDELACAADAQQLLERLQDQLDAMPVCFGTIPPHV